MSCSVPPRAVGSRSPSVRGVPWLVCSAVDWSWGAGYSEVGAVEVDGGCSDDLLRADADQTEDPRLVDRCGGDQKCCRSGLHHSTGNSCCGKVFGGLYLRSQWVDYDVGAADCEWFDDGLSCPAGCFFSDLLRALFGLDFASAVDDEAHHDQ